jgi:hypothetical protein
VTVLISRFGDDASAPEWLVRVLWITCLFAAAVALAGLALTLVRWLVYLRRRPRLDTVGAEAVSEIHARLSNRRREP